MTRRTAARPCARRRWRPSTPPPSIPAAGRNRIRSMVESRPDWLISRQRAWGSPLAMFVDKDTGQPLHDPDGRPPRIVEAIAAEGADAWFTQPAADFLGGHDPERYEKVEDILDVWFDSGSTHAFVLEGRRRTARWPADLYLEGSDQHRGWFQSSLLESLRHARPRALRCGADPRLHRSTRTARRCRSRWATPSSRRGDHQRERRGDPAPVGGDGRLRRGQRIGKTILQTTVDAYRKLRNTVRYLLGALAGFDAAERVALDDMPPLERFILHRLRELDGQVRARLRDATASRTLAAAGRVLLQRPVGAVFRHPPRRPLLRPAGQPAPPRLPHGDGRGVRAADRLAGADPAPSPWKRPGRRGFPTPAPTPAGVPRHARRLAQRGRGRALGQGRGGDPRGHRRAGGRAAREAHRRGAGGRSASCSSPTRPARRLRGLDRRRGVPHQPARAGRSARVRPAPSAAGRGRRRREPLRAEGRKCARCWRVLPEVGADPRCPDLSLRDAEDAVARLGHEGPMSRSAVRQGPWPARNRLALAAYALALAVVVVDQALKAWVLQV